MRKNYFKEKNFTPSTTRCNCCHRSFRGLLVKVANRLGFEAYICLACMVQLREYQRQKGVS